MEFGIFDHMDHGGQGSLSQFYEDRLGIVELYDQSGIYAYHLAEHHANPLGMAPSPNIFLSAVAQRTKKLRFGPLVYCLPLYHPIRLLEEICMLDQMSGGRLEMGVGRGISPIELNYWGIKYDDGPLIYKEVFDLITKGISDNKLNHNGSSFQINDMPMNLSLIQQPHPPLWYGVANPSSVEWPAEKGLNIITNQPVEKAKQITSGYKEVWSRLGRDEDNLPFLGMTRYIVISEDSKKAKKLADRAYPKWRKSFMSLWDLHGKKPVGVTYPETFSELSDAGQGIAGNPSEILDKISLEIESADINYFVARFAFGDLQLDEVRESIELFSEKIMPELKGGS